MKYLTLILFAIFLCSCNTETSSKEANKTAKPVVTTCFIAASNQDTVTLQLKDSNSIITGVLNYLPYEKDSRTGNLYDIKFSGDTLFAIYQSTQEGQESFCEMAILKRNNSYILTNDIWSNNNYQFDSSYTHGKFIDKTRIDYKGDTLIAANCK